MSEFFTLDVFSAFLQVVLIDLVLAGDNAVVIGLAAAGLPEGQRGKDIEREEFRHASCSPYCRRSDPDFGGGFVAVRDRR